MHFFFVSQLYAFGVLVAALMSRTNVVTISVVVDDVLRLITTSAIVISLLVLTFVGATGACFYLKAYFVR